ncbi:MAG TPA: glycosyltransferase family 4 protein, partial [Chitinophagaceae bacterium]|nr:glycosyltransferase family 4 protein [Chitinophagaceae bacterium]
MRIGFVSFEYPPDTGIGGIATYIHQMAHQFARKGVDVAVVCGSYTRDETVWEHERISVTRIRCQNTVQFNPLAAKALALLHNSHPFDLIETPEYGAGGGPIKQQLPKVPLLVKLHTPGYLIKALNDVYYDTRPLRKIKKAFGLGYRPAKDKEYEAILSADYILSPSHSLKDMVAQQWKLDPARILHAPNPYYPSPALLDIPVAATAHTILYLGRLETRKGVWNLSKAIPRVIKQVPGAQFIFLGRDSRGPLREKSMKAVLRRELGAAET